MLDFGKSHMWCVCSIQKLPETLGDHIRTNDNLGFDSFFGIAIFCINRKVWSAITARRALLYQNLFQIPIKLKMLSRIHYSDLKNIYSSVLLGSVVKTILWENNVFLMRLLSAEYWLIILLFQPESGQKSYSSASTVYTETICSVYIWAIQKHIIQVQSAWG